jgi:hypothetical protein
LSSAILLFSEKGSLLMALFGRATLTMYLDKGKADCALGCFEV